MNAHPFTRRSFTGQQLARLTRDTGAAYDRFEGAPVQYRIGDKPVSVGTLVAIAIMALIPWAALLVTVIL